MYPNPQDALPLPPRPNLEQYRKLAKDLAKACRSADRLALREWATRWLTSLANALTDGEHPLSPESQGGLAAEVEKFASEVFHRDPSAACTVASAQFVIARAHGFASWPRLRAHIESSADRQSPIATFEAAVDAIVIGDVPALARLLDAHPGLVRARSTREHRATLLHYVSANGVENYRQRSPAGILAIARLLLERGAEVDAEADVYGSGCTTLGLVATSEPPRIAGHQRALVDLLLAHGARMERRGLAGRDHSLVASCLANGQRGAAEYLAARGAPVDLRSAAGLGQADVVDREIAARAVMPMAELNDALSMASTHGRTSVIDVLLAAGADVNVELHDHGDGHTALHAAAFHGHADVVDRLLAAHARVDVVDKTWGTTPLVWALTGWARPAHQADRGYYQVAASLVRAGAVVPDKVKEWDMVRNDPLMQRALGDTGSLQGTRNTEHRTQK